MASNPVSHHFSTLNVSKLPIKHQILMKPLVSGVEMNVLCVCYFFSWSRKRNLSKFESKVDLLSPNFGHVCDMWNITVTKAGQMAMFVKVTTTLLWWKCQVHNKDHVERNRLKIGPSNPKNLSPSWWRSDHNPMTWKWLENKTADRRGWTKRDLAKYNTNHIAISTLNSVCTSIKDDVYCKWL